MALKGHESSARASMLGLKDSTLRSEIKVEALISVEANFSSSNLPSFGLKPCWFGHEPFLTFQTKFAVKC